MYCRFKWLLNKKHYYCHFNLSSRCVPTLRLICLLDMTAARDELVDEFGRYECREEADIICVAHDGTPLGASPFHIFFDLFELMMDS